MLSLKSGGAVLDLLPQIGGAVSRFSVDGSDVLRPSPTGTSDVLQTACFPLVPFANRIAHGTFAFAGETVHLPRNFGDHPHPLHGQGWQNPWRVIEQSDAAATLAYEHAADAWPWYYAAEQCFELSPRSLTISLTVFNRDTRPMPVSLGFHPYFASTGDSVLRADVQGVWLSDADCIPTKRARASHFLDLAKGALLAAAPFVDNCHFGWTRAAQIEQAARKIVMTASVALDHLHVFVPKGEGFFCVEPVSAMPDAFHHPKDAGGLHVIAPAESFCAAMALTVADW